jgi:hypothetical protein
VRALASLRGRGIALTGLAMIVAGCIWAAVAWASTVVQVDGAKGQVDVTVQRSNADVNEEMYNLPNGRKRLTGYSLEKVLRAAGVGKEGWTRIFIGGVEVRSDEEFSGEDVPVFALTDNDQNVEFWRPKKGSKPAVRVQGSNLDMNYRVPIEITPPLDNPETGETIKFRADAPGRDSQYEFEWNASSGETGTGTTFEYTFPSSPGRVQINVEATSNGNVEAEQTIGTPVKAPPEEDSGDGGSSTYTPPSGGYGSGYSYTPPATDYDSNFPEYDDGSDTTMPDAPKPPDPDETAPLEDPGISVSGELLSATAPLPPSSGDAGAAPPDEPDPEAAIEEAEEISAPGALIGAGIVVGLLGLGAGREMETMRPRRLRRPDLTGLRRLLPPWK